MNIIFGKDLDQILNNYTLLELDTFQSSISGKIATAWCVLDNLSLQSLLELDSLKKIHQEVVNCYKNQEWGACLEGITLLKGQWNGEVDSYYEILEKRVQETKFTSVDPSWSSTIVAEF